MKPILLLILITLMAGPGMADDMRTWIANLKDKQDCELQIKCYSSDQELIQGLQELNKLGFSLKSFSSIEDGGSTAHGEHAFRFVIYAQGRDKNGHEFTEGRGGVARTLKEALLSAQKKHAALQKDVAKERNGNVAADDSGALLQLKKIVISHEPWQSSKHGELESDDGEEEAPSNDDKPSN